MPTTAPSSTGCSGRRSLFEWQAFIYPIEDLPLIRARMREPWGPQKWQQWQKQFLQEQSRLRRYVLRGSSERNGPTLSRELQHDAPWPTTGPSGGGRAPS